ncbi:efflux RND transporter periplasmic adaptor subunit [Phenylobacterium montanum]|uniref:Efflux RND transporter periplasmic adaptor subunit n=1 Tax=Phenylobacterium montanum TaxID=2823693 RepID=A0A975G2N4_9CAUL|nr:efflux RND transporter periplasmic adaptor subunit [Caulobacter sp. S6]QUD89770.1 efflux RND transporter periplasmic adaptor subunit [Caulobacter sp. S6]
MKRTPVVIAVSALLLMGGFFWWRNLDHKPASEITLYGNLDLRQVELAFNGAERIDEVLVSEGDHVHRGQILARLDTGRLAPQAAQAQAQVATQQQVVDRLRHGSRPEEIAQARANLVQAEAEAVSAKARYERMRDLAQNSNGRALSRQDLDDAKAAADAAAARAEASRQALRLQVIGPRREDIAQAQAQLAASKAQAALLRKQLADAQLAAPLDAVVRSRLAEPGEMASPQKPVFSLAITDPKWVRAYVSETDLGHVHPGMAATVTVDAFPKQAFKGWVGFISPVAEFTPKTVQTPDLRTSLVYEIRVFVKDPHDDLRLGMPATVHLPLHAGDTAR